MPATITEISHATRLGVLPCWIRAFVQKSEPAEKHLRLFAEQNALGVQVSVYNVNAKKWIAPSESVETIEQGKLKAATYAETYLRQVANLELPPLQWKESRAA